jgi:hypothetical protein
MSLNLSENLTEHLTRTLIVVASLARPVYIVAGVTFVAAAVLFPLCRRTWLNKGSFSWLGVFCYQSPAGCVRIACAWTKLLILLVLLAENRVLDLAEYLMLILPGLLYALLSKSPVAFVSKFMWTALETVGLLAVNILCGYIVEMNPDFGYVIVYVLLSVFMGVFGVYLFLRELHATSTERRRGIDV